MTEREGERIAKRLARAGVASRRDAEAMVLAGRVAVNGRVIESPALNVTARDAILVDGRPLPEAEAARLWRYHKPAGLVTTARDEKGRPTVFDRLPEDMPRVLSIGRLDLASEGLLLLTNDGALKRGWSCPRPGGSASTGCGRGAPRSIPTWSLCARGSSSMASGSSR